jgi:hypothetical protein
LILQALFAIAECVLVGSQQSTGVDNVFYVHGPMGYACFLCDLKICHFIKFLRKSPIFQWNFMNMNQFCSNVIP